MKPTDLQFWFKINLGCAHAMFAFTAVCRVLHCSWQYSFHGLPGCKKAFDRVNHIKLLNNICDIGVPRHVIRLMFIELCY